jgi:fructokinase
MRIGIDLGGTKIEVIALGDDDQTLFRHRVSTPSGDYAGILRAIVDLVALAEKESGRRGSIGIATPGAISTHTALMKNSNSTILNGKPLDHDLAKALGRPIHIENDANCFALSEAVDGAAAGANAVFGVILGTGVGGGLVIGQQLVSGRNRIGGEWGHNPLPWANDNERICPRCYCGKKGCIETFLSGAGLSREYSERTGRNLTALEIAAAAREDKIAKLCLGLYQDRLARSLATIVNVVDPDVIVLGGGLSNIAELYTDVPKLISAYSFSDGVDISLVRAVHGDSSGVRGAARLWPVA